MPSAVWMASARIAWKPGVSYPPIRFVRFSGWAVSKGVERHPNQKRQSPNSSAIAKKIGVAVQMDGLREGIRQRKCAPDQLWHGAMMHRILRIYGLDETAQR